MAVEAINLMRLGGSFKKKTPMKKAKTMLVSLKAVTKAIGAFVRAQITSAYAVKDPVPPISKCDSP